MRNMKNVLTKTCGGKFLRAKVLSQYIFNLAYKPFESSAWSEVKAAMFKRFVQTYDWTSDIFKDFAHLIAHDHRQPQPVSVDDYEALWMYIWQLNRADPDVDLTTVKGPMAKSARWFAWHDAYEGPSGIGQFWLLAMVLQSEYGTAADLHGDADDDARLEEPGDDLARMRETSTGFKLAHRALTADLHSKCKMIYWSTVELRTWYGYQTKHVLSPLQGLRFLAESSQGRWSDHILAILAAAFSADALADMKFSAEVCAPDKMASWKDYVELACNTAGLRCWTMAVYDTPPFCYAALTEPGSTEAQEVAQTMKNDWRLIQAAEQRSLLDPSVARTVAAMGSLRKAAIRVLYAKYELDRFSSSSEAGHRCLRSLLQIIPDTKVVEDCHGHLRALNRLQSRGSSSMVKRMVTASDSGVVERRQVHHAKTTFEDFAALYRHKHMRSSAKAIWESKANLPAQLSSIMGRRDWYSPASDKEREGFGAWWWLCRSSTAHVDPHRRAHTAWLTSLMRPHTIIWSKASGYCLHVKHAKFAGLALELAAVHNGHAWFFSLTQRMQIICVEKLFDWFCYEAELIDPVQAMAMSMPSPVTWRAKGGRQKLLTFAFAGKVELGFTELGVLAGMIGCSNIPNSSQSVRQRIRERIADLEAFSPSDKTLYINDGNSADGASVASLEQTLESDALTTDLWHAMDTDEQADLPELAAAFKKHRQRAERALRQKLSERKAVAKKGRAKATASTGRKKRSAPVGKFAAAVAKRLRKPEPEEVEPTTSASASAAAVASAAASGEGGAGVGVTHAPPRARAATVHRQTHEDWLDVACPTCNAIAGHYKRVVRNGDIAWWAQAAQEDGSYAKKGEPNSVRLMRNVGVSSDWPTNFILKHSRRCPCARENAAPAASQPCGVDSVVESQAMDSQGN
eukprot:TRINITY_DN16267_c0_g3_i1.p1 TRINITY_DN16267_c0_g3~~TRINITY_DN16267_c0_g3_i1.p1  ORF type:complete len:912 (-),score=81.92 TRINITY_DN16267_c0_g3_i1:60-2795(-)